MAAAAAARTSPSASVSAFSVAGSACWACCAATDGTAAHRYLRPIQPPCRASHAGRAASTSSMVTQALCMAGGSARPVAAKAWAAVSRTGPTAASDPKSLNLSSARAHSSRMAASHSHAALLAFASPGGWEEATPAQVARADSMARSASVAPWRRSHRGANRSRITSSANAWKGHHPAAAAAASSSASASA